jgi:predicted regulator of Ras-like GTPase activity (Roadblock/LC7/MglB family)
VLRDFASSAGIQASAVVSRSGVPLAWDLPEETHVDNFGTMSATLIGALEVIYAGLHKAAPERIVVESGGSVLVAIALTPGAFLVAVADRVTPQLESILKETAKKAKPFLGSED